jgi:16S rRNA processing protein RimM
LGPQGRRGEVLAELHTDFPDRFEQRRTLWALAEDGSRRELQLEEHWFHKGGVVLKFAGVDSINDAETLAKLELQIPAEQRAELEEGAAFVSELVGCEFWTVSGGEPELLGTVKDLQFGAGEAPLLVIRRKIGSTEDLLVPYAAEFVRSVDLQRRRIEMQLPEGLLELESPLSEDEKQRQKAEADEVRAAGIRRKPRRN